MKKIIATVLAMVMALALCTVAFAATSEYTKVYNKKGVETELQANTTVSVVTVPAEKNVSVKGYHVSYTPATGSAVTNAAYVVADAKDYDLKLTADGKSALYLSAAPNNTLEYDHTAKLFTNVGDKCEQLGKDTDDTYYSYTDDNDNTTYFVKDSEGETNLLVDGKLVAATVLQEGLTAHTWKAASYDKDGNVATYKCKDCGTVATVYKTKDAAIAAGVAMTDIKDGNVIGWTMGGTAKPADGTNKSPKTFDAGIAMYVGMALTSVAGSAVVIGKKKEF